jgi:microcystin-dependent protein
LSTGNPLKIVKGTEIDTEFNNIATAVATKADLNSPALIGTPTAPTASSGTNTTQVATTAFVLANANPTGGIMMWGTGTAPTGYLLCAGAAVSRSTYAALFAVIGTTFGVGDGSTTFNVPNYTNRMPYGATVGTTGGSADAVLVSHTHTATSTVTDPQHAHGGSYMGPNNVGQGGRTDANQATNFSSTNSASTGITVATTNTTEGVSGVGQNLPPYLGINFIIKT